MTTATPRPPSRPTRPSPPSRSGATSPPRPRSCVRAHTDPELFARWIGPDSVTTRIDHWDCRTLRLLPLRQRARRRGVRLPRHASPTSARTGSCRPSPGRDAGGDRPGDDDVRGPRRRHDPPARLRPCATRSRAGTRCCPAAWTWASARATASWTPSSPRTPPEMTPPERTRPRGRCPTRPPTGTASWPTRSARSSAAPVIGGRPPRSRGGPPATWSATWSSGSPPSCPAAGSSSPPGRRSPTIPSPRGTTTPRPSRPSSRTAGEESFTHPYAGTHRLADAVDRFYTADVFMHSWDLARAPPARRSTSTRTTPPGCWTA